MSAATQSQSQHRGIDVGAIDNHAKPRVLIFERGRNGAWLAAGERSHGVKQMREAGKPLGERSSGLGVGRHGMPQSDASTGRRQIAYETSPHLLGRECDERWPV